MAQGVRFSNPSDGRECLHMMGTYRNMLRGSDSVAQREYPVYAILKDRGWKGAGQWQYGVRSRGPCGTAGPVDVLPAKFFDKPFFWRRVFRTITTNKRRSGMKKILVALVALSVLAIGSVAFARCGGAPKSVSAAVSTALCPKCGEVAGSANCCKGGAELCAGCGLHKGSPGCMLKCTPPAAVPAVSGEAVPAS
jgi:hypothetical protein